MSYLTEERKMIQQTARDFAMKEVLPIANKLDPVEGDMPMELRNKMGELGYFGILIPEEYGGLGLGVFEYALVAEELARAMDERREHHRARQRHLGRHHRGAETQVFPARWRAANSSALSRSRSPTPAPTSPTSPAARPATATNG